MNGIEFLKEIRRTDKDTRVVIMTGLGDKEYVEKIVQLGITDYVIKSEFILQLEDRIADILYSNIAVFK
jgi:DNA-binding NarL/FixJ family response regulator